MTRAAGIDVAGTFLRWTFLRRSSRRPLPRPAAGPPLGPEGAGA